MYPRAGRAGGQQGQAVRHAAPRLLPRACDNVHSHNLLCVRAHAQGVLGGNKGGLFGMLHHDYSPVAAASCMGRLAKLSARHMGNRGFTIGEFATWVGLTNI